MALAAITRKAAVSKGRPHTASHPPTPIYTNRLPGPTPWGLWGESQTRTLTTGTGGRPDGWDTLLRLGEPLLKSLLALGPSPGEPGTAAPPRLAQHPFPLPVPAEAAFQNQGSFSLATFLEGSWPGEHQKGLTQKGHLSPGRPRACVFPRQTQVPEAAASLACHRSTSTLQGRVRAEHAEPCWGQGLPGPPLPEPSSLPVGQGLDQTTGTIGTAIITTGQALHVSISYSSPGNLLSRRHWFMNGEDLHKITKQGVLVEPWPPPCHHTGLTTVRASIAQ